MATELLDILEDDEDLSDYEGRRVAASIDLVESMLDGAGKRMSLHVGENGSLEGLITKVTFKNLDQALIASACFAASRHDIRPQKHLDEFDAPIHVTGTLAENEGGYTLAQAVVETDPELRFEKKRRATIHVDNFCYGSKPVFARIDGTEQGTGKRIHVTLLNDRNIVFYDKSFLAKLSNLSKDAQLLIEVEGPAFIGKDRIAIAAAESQLSASHIRPDNTAARPAPEVSRTEIETGNFRRGTSASGHAWGRTYDVMVHGQALTDKLEAAAGAKLPGGEARTRKAIATGAWTSAFNGDAYIRRTLTALEIGDPEAERVLLMAKAKGKAAEAASL